MKTIKLLLILLNLTISITAFSQKISLLSDLNVSASSLYKVTVMMEKEGAVFKVLKE